MRINAVIGLLLSAVFMLSACGKIQDQGGMIQGTAGDEKSVSVEMESEEGSVDEVSDFLQIVPEIRSEEGITVGDYYCQCKVIWDEIEDADGYEIEYGVFDNDSIKETIFTDYFFIKFQDYTRIHARVRGCKNSDGKRIYTEWSNVFELKPGAVNFSSYGSEELKKLFVDRVNPENVIYYFYDDFDSDGNNEAFGITGEYSEADGLYSDVYIYFISATGKIQCVNDNQPTYGYLTTDGLFSAERKKFLLWEQSAGGSGSITLVYGVKNGNVYELDISEKYMCFGTSLEYMGIENSGQQPQPYVGFVSDFSKGYHDDVPVYFVFDESTLQFVES